MRATVLKDDALVKLAGRFVWLEIDTEKDGNAPFLERHPIQVWPTFLVVDPATEKAVLRWMGTATAPDLVRLLADGERAVKGGEGATAEELLARADRANGEGRTAEAVGLWREALAKGGPGWERRSRVLESLALGRQSSRQEEACAELAVKEAPGMPRGQSFANVVSVGLSCALSGEDARWARSAAGALEPLAREALALPGVLADDRAGLYESLVQARKAAKDEAGARKLAGEWWAFLVVERERGTTPAGRTMLDAWIVSAALELGEPARALPLLEESERAVPGDYNPPYRIALLDLELGRLDAALAANGRALAVAYGPRKLRVLTQRAGILERKGDLAGARAALQEALAHAGTLPPAQRNPRAVERIEAQLRKLGGG
jgi:tetratricopeptide (TPR) repeat protein